MSVQNILQEIDREIASLNQARALLSSLDGSTRLKAVSSSGSKRVISAAARRKMARAQKARWAKYRASKKAK
jgi:superfamily I DNA and RNA helicase